MPPLEKVELREPVVRAIRQAGWQVVYLSEAHPFRLAISRGQEAHLVRVYIWNVTHGGGQARPAHERRIQATGVAGNQFAPEPGGKTLILGYADDLDVFVGFELRRHRRRYGASPSFQVSEQTLRQARASRFAVQAKGNRELAVGFRPDFLVEYIANLEPLHDLEPSTEVLRAVASIAANPALVDDTLIDALPAPRQQALRSYRGWLRAADFRDRILQAYRHSCALCGLQLGLVQSAHIIPVSYPGSTDETCNGLALCPLHHAAYDGALVGVADDYRVMVNLSRLKDLRSRDRAAGERGFLAGLRPTILLPDASADRPLREYLSAANQARGWSEVEAWLVGAPE